jgi:hypothetical protein
MSNALPTLVPPSWDRTDLAGIVAPLRGRRLIVVNQSGSHRDYRAWGELRTSAGATVVDVITEAEWWRYRYLAMRPQPRRWPAAAVWVEMP